MRDVDTIITIRPTSPGQYSAHYGGHVLVRASSEPFCAAGRAMLAQGWPPDTTIALQHEGSPHIAMRAQVGCAAALTVESGRDGVPRFRRWKAPPSVGPTPPMRVGEAAAPGNPEAGALSDETAEVAP